MKKNSTIFYICGIVITLFIIILILFNTIFYDYKTKLRNYLNTYYAETENNIDNINKLIDRYKNNANKSDSVNEIIENDINYRIDDFNKEYNTNEDLTNAKDKLIGKFNYLFDNLSNNVSLINNKDTASSIVNKLYESKTSFLAAITYYNNNNYNEAYENFIKVIENDSYYDETTSKIDEMFNNEVKTIEEEVRKSINITDETTDNDKINIYKKALEYITNKKKELSFDISKSKSFITIKEELNTNLVNLYLKTVEDYENNSKFDDALNLINEAINLLNDNELDASKLIEKKEKLNKTQPISLTSIQSSIDGNSIKEELAISDKNNDAYARSITFYKNNKSSITYEVNKEYKYLSGTINISKEVNQKNKNYGRIIIYGDNKRIYDSSDLNTKFKKKNIKLNINDINTIKIEYTISNNRSINKSNILVALFGNPTLEKY